MEPTDNPVQDAAETERAIDTFAQSSNGGLLVLPDANARVLAFALATTRTSARALQRYDAQRRPIMTAVTLKNREFGPAIVMEIAEQRAPNGFENIEDVIALRELEDISRNYKVGAGFDPSALNKRPSLTVPRTIRMSG
jgi:5-methylphenazine-1-carboxylate 1-monooxygenase